MKKPRAFLSALMLVSLLLFPGCAEKRRVQSGDAAPGFSARDIAGTLATLNQFKGHVVVLYFWTNTCCGDKLKQIEPLYARYRQQGLAVMAINVGDPGEEVASSARRNGLTFTMLIDEEAKIFKQYGVMGFPTLFILDRNGIIRQKIVGEVQAGQLEKLIRRQFDMQKDAEAAYEKTHRR